MKRLGIADRAFLLAETREAPMHVGGIHLFTLPQGVQEQRFLHQMADNLRATEQFQSPFGERLKMGPLGALGPVFWEPDDALDPDYHIRHSALPRPGRYRELFALVSRLHGAMMDRHRPLWEMHLIEGLQKRQFAVYSKYHHAAIDGIRSMHLTQSMFSTDARARIDDSPLSVQAWERYRARLQQAEPLGDAQVRNVAEGFDERYVDALFLDMREPWEHLAAAREALKGGGFFGSLLPTTNQVSDLLRGLQTHGFADLEVQELFVRNWKPIADRLRPSDRMIAHTGLLVFARKADIAEGDTWRTVDAKRYRPRAAGGDESDEIK